MNEMIRDINVPNDWDRSGLPGWCYHSPALLELERQHVFREHWQIACHVSDIPEPGNYLAMDVVGERALILRGQDGAVRAFHNICRHRGSRLVADEKGSCRNALVCPFHGWVYNLDGTLRGAARPRSFPPLDKDEFALKALECEIWQGFVFIRFAPGPQPSVAALMKPFEAELAHYRTGEMIPAGAIWTQETPVNWKSVRDVDNEGYHVAMAHPALQDLYGSTYYDEPFVDGICRSFATYNPHAGRRWSVRNYVKISPENHALPERLRKAWIYFGLFPNAVIAVTPETVQFYQEFPLGVGKTLLRGGIYRYRQEERAHRLARYLAFRIDRDTQAEDVQLTVWSNEAMTSNAFAGFYLSDLEYGVRTHHDHLRKVVPVMTLKDAPEEKDMAGTNAGLAEGR
ncbi:aromatic ring-hydroxylating dioxygenase subunit alpha [Shinella sp. 838]|jgi:phenylpropionate dioxygenase-like ring-hydroxylating dioxygenase large terminal subunit|uniref:aromatic ring-hydroxylating oxygenase subunit alpha n=1 Tax=unclassified Shinella TaxID=2643062 RepID=UPI0003C55266|nr:MULTISPECIES: aromatic ring-hydroxylating dioxygenase subunit alpha [unclassified Shinella]EYR81723.1 rieske (2Fe-2S) iron-sulfur domain-containing protein [Shinella sp. DD12]MCA0342711.1 aromatic ring-hydroxylating dioxygenase subunit alpha [Pseudomonadota bacterium]MDG4670470.1 aromatic ring-hydroxylating dioxygenase subunit alpha [Shinella sp. 838]